MTHTTRTSWAALALCLALVACDQGEAPGDAAPEQGTEEPAAHDHSGDAKHGGAMVEVGEHDALLEVVHDEDAGVVRVWVTDFGGAELKLDAEPLLNITTDGAPVQVEGTIEDAAWTFRDEVLKGHAKARLRLAVGGKTFNPELPDVH